MTNTTTGRTDMDAVARLIELRDGFFTEADETTGRESKELADHKALGVQQVLNVVTGAYSSAEEAEQSRKEILGLAADQILSAARGDDWEAVRARRLTAWSDGYNQAVELSGMSLQFAVARAVVATDDLE